MSYFCEDLRSADVQWAAEPDEGGFEFPNFLHAPPSLMFGYFLFLLVVSLVMIPKEKRFEDISTSLLATIGIHFIP